MADAKKEALKAKLLELARMKLRDDERDMAAMLCMNGWSAADAAVEARKALVEAEEEAGE